MCRDEACLAENEGVDLNSAPAMGKKLATESVVLKTFGNGMAVNVGVGDTGDLKEKNGMVGTLSRGP